MKTKKLKILILISVVGLFFHITLSTADSRQPADYPAVSFAVFTDPHYYDTSLGSSGKAFRKYLDNDRKLLLESSELLDEAVKGISPLDADFVIVCGDLTKDGEKHNHRMVAEKLKKLEESGKKVYVVPGNHDIANGAALRFTGDTTMPVETVTSQEFEDIYKDYGYSEAIDRAPRSLSYVAEPVSGLWLIGLDSCKWRENEEGKHPITGGVIYPETMEWLDSVLAKAQQNRKSVIVFLHHGIMEHYPSNLKYYSEYVLDNHEAVAEKLATGGVKLVFTGHFHAQDVSSKAVGKNGETIYDIETGSLVTAPCPYRTIRITEDQRAVIESSFITALPSHPAGFRSFADTYLFEGTEKMADTALSKFRVSQDDRDRIKPQVARAYSAHLAGDEKLPPVIVDTDELGLWGRFVVFTQRKLIEGWYTDIKPGDNNLTIDLR